MTINLNTLSSSTLVAIVRDLQRYVGELEDALVVTRGDLETARYDRDLLRDESKTGKSDTMVLGNARVCGGSATRIGCGGS